METLRTWSVAVCAAAVVGTLARRFFPDTALGRQGRLVTAALFLVVLATPLFSIDFDVKLSNFTSEEPSNRADLTAAMEAQMERQVNAALLEMVNESLQNYGLAAQKVTASMDIGEDGSISMGQIVVYVDEETARRSAALGQVARQRLGTAVEVAVWEGEE